MPEPSANLIVVHTERFGQCRDFYAGVGLEFVEEQHGGGPVHVAATLPAGTIFEIYPSSAKRATGRLRLGFSVASTTDRAPGTAQVVDPDGRVVELHVAATEAGPRVVSPLVLVDMDNVIADFDRRFLDLWAARHPTSRLPARHHHRIVDDLPPGQRAEATALFAEAGFTTGMAPVDGAREALGEIADHGFSVHVCTSPLSARSPNAAEKLDWIEDNLGPEWRHRTIITKDKTLVRGDVLIDDAVTVTGAMTPTWRHVVFDRPVNRDAPAGTRMTWATWRDVLLDPERDA